MALLAEGVFVSRRVYNPHRDVFALRQEGHVYRHVVKSRQPSDRREMCDWPWETLVA